MAKRYAWSDGARFAFSAVFSGLLFHIAFSHDGAMSDPYFQQLFAERIGGSQYGKGSEIYKFEKIKRAKRKALAEHPERKLVDFGIGENDEMADASVRRVMAEEINKPRESRLRRQRHPGVQRGGGAVHGRASSTCRSIRPRRSTIASARRRRWRCCRRCSSTPAT